MKLLIYFSLGRGAPVKRQLSFLAYHFCGTEKAKCHRAIEIQEGPTVL